MFCYRGVKSSERLDGGAPMKHCSGNPCRNVTRAEREIEIWMHEMQL